jgi:outer membrane protein OmpA-like peptidoglycan-associated protein
MRCLAVSLFLLVHGACSSQQFVLNGGFEEENTCTEYNVNCAPEAWIGNGINNYIRDANRAYEGVHCMAIVAGHTERDFVRTFIRTQLVCPLRRGNTYRLEFFVKSPARVLDSIGVYFGRNDFLLERKPIYRLAPSLYLHREGNSFTRDSSWQKASLDYTAEGDEMFLTIANFARRDVTGTSGFSMDNYFRVFVDNVSLLPTDPHEQLCADWQESKQAIYDLDARHHMLDKLISYRRTTGPLNLPLHPPTRMLHVDTLLLPDVLFATAKTDLRPASFALLDSFYHSVAGRDIDSLVIEGHADSTGKENFNESLSTGRAAAVANYLRHYSNFSQVPFIQRGWGSTRPVATNQTPAGRQRNRRVVVFLYLRE